MNAGDFTFVDGRILHLLTPAELKYLRQEAPALMLTSVMETRTPAEYAPVTEFVAGYTPWGLCPVQVG